MLGNSATAVNIHVTAEADGDVWLLIRNSEDLIIDAVLVPAGETRSRGVPQGGDAIVSDKDWSKNDAGVWTATDDTDSASCGGTYTTG